MSAEIIETNYIPLDKSWVVRMGILDLIHEHDSTTTFLSEQEALSDDLIALKKASEVWLFDEPVPVGESGTLYRFLSFVSWKFDLEKEFITAGTLLEREVTRDPSIVSLSQSELLQLDNQTSQWASAAVLCGDSERLSGDVPYKLNLTYEAVEHWEERRAQGNLWLPRLDNTIARQASTYRQLLEDEATPFEPEQAEDYCFAVALGYIDAEEGAERWPNLKGHETNRLVAMPAALEKAKSRQTVDSPDHRIVQAIALWARLMDREVEIAYPDTVNKSWPEFWDYLEGTR